MERWEEKLIHLPSLVKRGPKRVDQQADRGLFCSSTAVAHRIHFDDVHADEAALGSHALQQPVDFRKVQSIRFEGPCSGR